MNRNEIETAVLKILKNNYDVAESTDKDSLIEDIGMDSLDVIEAIMSFENEFDVHIPDEDAQTIKTINDLINYIDNKLN